MAIAERRTEAPVRWRSICEIDQLIVNVGVRALVNGRQIAIFRSAEDDVFAVDAIDPFCEAPVLSRGIIGDIDGRLVVASPVYKHHFDLATGQCLEDGEVTIDTFEARCCDGRIEVLVA